jgi:hypothetical protein
MFATLNLRWLIQTKDDEVRRLANIAAGREPQRWLQTVVHWCKRLI